MIEVTDTTPEKLRDFYIKLRNMQIAAVNPTHGHAFDTGVIHFSCATDYDLMQAFLSKFKKIDDYYYKDFENINVRAQLSNGVYFQEKYAVVTRMQEIEVRQGVYIQTNNIDVKYWLTRNNSDVVKPKKSRAHKFVISSE